MPEEVSNRTASGTLSYLLVVNVNGHTNIHHVDKILIGKPRDAGTSVARGGRRHRVAAMDGDTTVEIARVIDRAERRLPDAMYLAADHEMTTRRVGTLPFAVSEVSLAAAGRCR